MSILSLPKMVFSNEGWPELESKHLSLIRFFSLVVLPLALLPPVMLYYAGSHYGDLFVVGFGSKPWGTIAAIFYLEEIITVLIMGWLIREAAEWYGLRPTNTDAFMLAGIAPIPMWLSSLSLLVPNLAMDVGIALLALAAGCGLLYNGICAFCRTRDEVSAVGMTQIVMCAGAFFWVLLLVLVVTL
ncbi:MAG: YIP1 family protein [Proteobacteria bacterium]|nr:YIP1 family protein [Pseudomonadota bacterium]